MNIWIIIQVIVLVVGCVWATITDLIYGKISNKLTLAMCISGGSVSIVNSIINNIYFKELLINVFIFILLGCILYGSHIWAGGDCKLIIVIAIIYPCNFYWSIKNEKYNLWIIIGVAFIVGFLYLIFETLVFAVKDRKQLNIIKIKKNIDISIYNYLKTIVYLAALNHIYINLISNFLKIPQSIYVFICVLYSLSIQSIIIFNKKLVIGMTLMFDIIMVVLTKKLTISISWKTYMIVAIFIVVRYFINNYNYKTISVDELKKGMILSRNSSIWMQKSKVKGLPRISDESLNSRLKEEEVLSIKRWKKSKYGMENVDIVRKIPFAIFILVGVLTYLVIGVSLYDY